MQFSLIFFSALIYGVIAIPDNYIMNGYYTDSSSNIVLEIEGHTDTPMKAVILDPSGQYHVGPSSISCTLREYSALRLRSMGIAHRSISLPQLVRRDIYNLPTARVFITVDGMDGLSSSISHAASINLSDESFPRKTSNLLYVLSTGEYQSNRSPNLSSMLHQTIPQSFILSFSSCSDFASLTASSSKDSSFSIGFDSARRCYVETNRLSRFKLDIVDNLQSLNDALVANKQFIKLDSTGSIVEFHSSNSDIIRFSLTSSAALTFFAEVSYLPHLINVLKSDWNSFVQDQYPDLFNLNLVSMQAIADEFGAESTQFRAASEIIEHVIEHFVSRISLLYSNKLLIDLVYFGRQLPIPEPIASTLTEFFSSAQHQYQDPTLSKCVELSKLLEGMKVKVHCIGDSDEVGTSSLIFHNFDTVLLQVDANAGKGKNVDEIASYQIALWTSIILIVALIAAAYSVGGMQNRQESLFRDVLSKGL